MDGSIVSRLKVQTSSVLKKAADLPLKWKIGIALILVILLILASPFLIPLSSNGKTISYEQLKSEYRGEGEFVTVDGYTTFIIDKGSDKDKTIVLLHGFGSSSYTWRKIVDPLVGHGFRVITIDLKGFGYSERTLNQSYTPTAQAQLVYDILKQRNVYKATFVGHSLSVNILLHLSEKHSDMVEKLVFIDGTNEAPVDGLESTVIKTSLGIGYFQQITRHMLDNGFSHEGVRNLLVDAFAKDDMATDDLVSNYEKRLTAINGWEDGLVGFFRDNNENGVSEHVVRSLSQPVLVIWGADDPMISVDRGKAFSRLIKNEQMIIIPHVGHFPMEETPELFNQIVVDFVTK